MCLIFQMVNTSQPKRKGRGAKRRVSRKGSSRGSLEGEVVEGANPPSPQAGTSGTGRPRSTPGDGLRVHLSSKNFKRSIRNVKTAPNTGVSVIEEVRSPSSLRPLTPRAVHSPPMVGPLPATMVTIDVDGRIFLRIEGFLN